MSVFVPQPSIAWEEVEQALIDWVSDMTGLETIWTEEDAPQPTRPYATLDWLQIPTPVGDDYWYVETASTATQEVDMVLSGARRAVVTVNVHAAETRAGRNAAYFTDLLVNSLVGGRTSAQYFAPYRMAVWGVEPISKGDFAEEGHVVSRAGFDLTLGFAAGTGQPSERIGYITSASITANLSSPERTDSISVTS